MSKVGMLLFVAALATACAKSGAKEGGTSVAETPTSVEDSTVNVTSELPENDSSPKVPVEIVDTCNLRIYYPQYSSIDLTCGVMPSKDDSDVIFVAAAAFTMEKLNTFKHTNIAGDHVTKGKREHGSANTANTGAFVFYNGKGKFLYQDYSSELDSAATHGGCGFGQGMIIHQGEKVPHSRSKSDVREFRALCEIDGVIAVVDSKGRVKFGDFINDLSNLGVTEALYIDMGGWKYSWYRDADGSPIEIYKAEEYTKYATNWITFYKR